MSELRVTFEYKGRKIIMQCSGKDKLRKIIENYAMKTEIDINRAYFLYNGTMINEESQLKDIINTEDNKANMMNIIGFDLNTTTVINENINNINNELKDLICPKCQETTIINIEDYKINAYNCKNGHRTENMLICEFENAQNLDLSKIICENCKQYNKGNSYNNLFYRCITCNTNLCTFCKSNHDKNHIVINHDDINYKCNKDNKNLTDYCYNCNKNICSTCAKSEDIKSIK